MNKKITILHRGVAAVLAALLASPAFASSHMDAPLITRDPSANTTDVYAFVQDENVYIGGVGRRIARNEWRVHVAGGEGRRGQQRRQHSGHAAMQNCYLLVHKCFSSLCRDCGGFV